MTDDELLRRYVLDSLPEAEREALEQRLLVDEEAHQRLELEQDALVEAHLRGTLPPHESASLEARARANPELQRHLRQARLLRRHLAGEAPPRRFASWWLGAAAALVAAAAGAWWQAGRSEPARSAEATPPPAPSAPTPPPPDGPGTAVAALTLSPGQTMAGTGAEAVTLPAGTERLRLELLLEPPPAASYSVEVWSEDDRRVWSGRQAREGGEPFTLSLTLPAAPLKAGRYRLELAPGGASSSDTTLYYFEVRRR